MASTDPPPLKRTIKKPQLHQMVPLATAPSGKWKSGVSFLAVSSSPLAASSGILPRWRPGFSSAAPRRSTAPRLQTSASVFRAPSETRIETGSSRLRDSQTVWRSRRFLESNDQIGKVVVTV